MSRSIAKTACILLFITASVQGGDHADLSRAYAAQKADFTRQHQAQRSALRHSYRCSHDQLIAERQLIARIDCHKTRSARLRENSRELGALARENGRRHRELSAAYADGLRALRDEYDFARARRHDTRRYSPVTERLYDVHPAGCTCTACVPPTPIRHYDDHAYGSRQHFGNHHHARHRKANGIDIAVAILSMLQ